MFRFCSIFLASVYSFMIKVFGLIHIYVSRSKSSIVEENSSNSSINHPQQEDLQKSRKDSNAKKTEDSVLVISNSSKCQVMSCNNLSEFFEEPKTMKFVEMFVGPEESDDVLVTNDQRKDSLESDEESESSSFYFTLLNGSFSKDDHYSGVRSEEVCDERENEEREKQSDQLEDEIVEDQDFSYEVELLPSLCSSILPADQESDTDKKDMFVRDNKIGSENWMGDFLDKIDQERPEYSHEEVKIVDTRFVIKSFSEEDEDLEDEYIELVEQSDTTPFLQEQSDTIPFLQEQSDTIPFLQEEQSDTTPFLQEQSDTIPFLQEQSDTIPFLQEEQSDTTPFLQEQSDTKTVLQPFLQEQSDKTTLFLQEQRDTTLFLQEQSDTTPFLQEQSGATPFLQDDDDDEDETDVLSEHQNLVQQMKMELKNCRIKGLPTISEECESPKMVEDLKPLEIDHKIEYKDVMEEIQKFYRSYSEKMRKLDILNYQTLHSISFLQLKDSEVFTIGKKKAGSIHFVLQKLWSRKDQRVYADPMHKSITEMQRNLELVYVGQVCLSWEILCWLYAKLRDLIEYNLEGKHSYNRSAEDFQQFQVVMQRFVEDEQFKGHRNENYVKNRCTIRSLLQVPPVKDDCLKAKKERQEETDAISLEMLVGIIKESMLIFRDFLFCDKKSIDARIKGTNIVDLGNSSDVVTDLQKKERRIKDQIRSQNCIVNKLRRHQEWRRLDCDVLACEVELRLVSRVLSMSRLTMDQFVWCKNKLDTISFLGRKLHMEPSFLLFPC